MTEPVQHPVWCDPVVCTVRGTQGAHYSFGLVLPPGDVVDHLELRVRVWQTIGDERVPASPIFVELCTRKPGKGNWRLLADIDLSQLRAIERVFATLLEATPCLVA